MKAPNRLLTCVLSLSTALMNQAADYSSIPAKLEPVIREEMREWGIGGVAVALVDDQRVVYAAGFGEATRESVFRVGSISKLFNGLAVMQQVEAGKLDLDAPLPADVTPVNPFPGSPKVTLRHVLTHRSGFPREGTVGGYMDDSKPGLAATAASVAGSVLVTKPGEKTRYSNLAPSVAGRLVERVSNQSFEAYQRTHILDPLGMTSSAWTLAKVPRHRLIVSHMEVADGRGGFKRQPAPVFDLGTIPAGNLFSTVDDLSRFASALLAGGKGLLKPATLAEMFRPQFTPDKTGFGLAFSVGTHREHRTVSHGGAVYGHSCSFIVLPEQKVAVIVLANEDIAGGRVRRISNTALNLLLEAKSGEALPRPPAQYTPGKLDAFAGDYESQSYWARLEVRDGKLAGVISGQATRFTPLGELKFAAVSRLEDATPTTFTREAAGAITGFTLGAQRFERVRANPPPLPREWQAVPGSYGPKFIPLIITERHGHLYVMTENMVDYRLTPLNRHACLLPPGMYVDEQVAFLTDKSGRVHSLDFANMIFQRRN